MRAAPVPGQVPSFRSGESLRREPGLPADRLPRDGATWTERGRFRWVLILFLMAAVLRVGWVLVHFGTGARAEQCDYPDEDAYVLGARSLASGAGLIDEFGFRATYMPGYPAFIAIFQSLPRPLLWTRMVQALLAAWVAPATFLLALQFFATVRQDAPAEETPVQPRSWETATAEPMMAILAGLAAAFDPFLLFFSGLLLTEALFAAALVTAWLFVLPLARRHRLDVREAAVYAFLAGLSLGVGLMLRPSGAVLLILTPAAVLVLNRFDRAAWTYALVLLAVVFSGLLPWAVRNHTVLGEWRWLTTRGGISLYDGLQQNTTGGSDLAHTKTAPEVRGLGELEWDRYFHRLAIAEIRGDPGRVLRLAGRKFLRTWSLTPNEASYRSGLTARISAAWMVLILASAVIGWWSCRRRAAAWMLLLTPVAAFTALHMLYVGSVRYRVPEMPFVMVFSAMGLWSMAAILLPGCQAARRAAKG